MAQLRRDRAALVVCGNVGPEEDVRALHEALSAEAGTRVTPIAWLEAASGAGARATVDR